MIFIVPIVKRKRNRQIQKFTHVFTKFKQYCNAKVNKPYSNTEKAIHWFFHLFCSSVYAIALVNFGHSSPLNFLLLWFLAFLGLNIVRILITLTLKPLERYGLKTAIYIVMTIITICLIMVIAKTPAVPMLLTATAFTIIQIIFVRSLWALIINKRRTKLLCVSLVVAVLCNVTIAVFLYGSGYSGQYLNTYLSLSGKTDTQPVATFYDNQTEKSELEVTSLEYGNSADLSSLTTDLTPYMESYTGIKSSIRNLYWGHGPDSVPLRGKIWYPAVGENYPVLFIVHGNHSMTAPSYLGYDYLGEYLASYGYVVVSVDENFCNLYVDFGFSDEYDARAVLLLENMKQVWLYNEDAENVLYRKIDFDNITLAGHSRGGEAVSLAALFNGYSVYPDDGNLAWDYNFNIRSIIGIAPTADMYLPAEHNVILEDVNYLLIQGADDLDVDCFDGIKQYQNIRYTDGVECFKSYVYIAGANHGQFNTEWGKYDGGPPFKQLINAKSLMEETDQQTVLKAYVKTFLDVTVKQDSTHIELFTGDGQYFSDLPDTIYIKGYQASNLQMLCDFEEDSNIRTGTRDGILVQANHMKVWKESVSNNGNTESGYAAQLEWEGTKDSTYCISLPTYDIKGKCLQFDIMDVNTDAVSKGNYNILDCDITLSDVWGCQATIPMRSIYTVYPPLPIKKKKLDYLLNSVRITHCFQTVRLAYEDFEQASNALDTSVITGIEFSFNKSDNGKIMIDNIGFSQY